MDDHPTAVHDILEVRCRGCGFSMRGMSEVDAMRARRCRLCGLPMAALRNYNISRKLPLGMGLLMGAFAASLDSSPLTGIEPAPVPGFARQA